mgnify:CR=1 FL=1
MRLAFICSLSALLLFAGCNNAATPPDMAAPPDLTLPVGADAEIKILDAVTHKGGEITKGPFKVTLPAGGVTYAKITLHVDLGCPQGGCDPYDRIASIRLLPSTMGAPKIEVGRYITPFGVKGAWDLDVTDLAPVLAGERSFESYIETWAGGWVVTATLIYKGGVPDRIPVSVTPLPWDRLPAGDPKQEVDKALVPTEIAPGMAASMALRLVVTGHGQGNSDNCAEFCDLTHTVLVDGTMVAQKNIWRDDCDQNPVKNQKGTWMYPREGWCPGADVKPWTIDLGARAKPFTIKYGTPGYLNGMTLDPYINTCQPNNCMARTCAFGNPCAYDGGAHTEPNFLVSAAVIGYR